MKQLAWGALGVSWLALTGTAIAQEIPLPTDHNGRIAALEAQLSALEAQIADLKEASGADVAEVRRVAAEQPSVTLANGRPTISSSDGAFRFAVRGLVQFDAAHYAQDQPGTPDNRRADAGNASDLSAGANFRRARFGFEGTAFKDWNYALIYELGGTGTEGSQITQAYVEYAGWKPLSSAAPLRLRIGAWATPAGLEDATSNTESLFLERPAIAELVRGIAGGDGRTGVGAFWNGERWYASGALTGASVANTAEFDEQTGYLLRAAFLPLRTPDYAVHLGVNVTGVTDPADTDAGAADVQRLRLRERPELRVDGARFVDTGAINAAGLVAAGAEIGGYWKNFFAAGELFRIELDRRGAGVDPDFGGWYVQGAWTITGERRRWNGANGGFQGVRPSAPFAPGDGKWGAFEIAARYSDLDLDFHAGAAGSAAIANDTVRGGRQKITTVGLNWYPNQAVRFLLDYHWIQIDRLDPENGVVAATTAFGGAASVAGNGAEIGQDIKALSLRTQVAF